MVPVADVVIDTNVLLVASAAHPYSPFSETHVPVELRERVFDWLAEFRADAGSLLALDMAMEIYREYRNRLTDQDYGLQVVHERMATARLVEIGFDGDGWALVPGVCDGLDRSDRKFLAVALDDPTTISIVNAADTDWLEISECLAATGARVVQLLPDWLADQHEGKT